MTAIEFMLDRTHQAGGIVPLGATAAAATNNGNAAAVPWRRLEGKVAIVTGGARGIGEAIVRAFVRHGARVVVADIDDAAGEALAAALGLGGACCSYVHCDVSEEADVERAVGCCVERYGRLDVLCNNAGVLGRQDPPAANGCTKSGGIASLDAAEFDRVLRVNTLGAALGMKHAARAMLQRRGGGGGGSIVSVTSVAGVMGGMGPHAYTASKHALVGLTKNAACELGEHGIRVNCVSPFGVATPMLVNAWRHRSHDDDEEADGIAPAPPSEQEVEKTEEMVRGLATLKGATLRAGDIAEAALFLASDESRYISGHNLVVDGGVTTSRNVIGL
ncbi:sex determination protein tasselseed-2-like [Lolium perenne]|uniref:sex determination protein tasselseed-2-like n=1 Tax=Lolium perenne TaxID=4522 RepID=UPI0021EADBC9|nr:sex determination protein tasselseed-2-like isoform X1 [Lolium perenne]XP_051213474.1 sex determination protein tasselseed-2-like isoform X2 [Lolium perenne]